MTTTTSAAPAAVEDPLATDAGPIEETDAPVTTTLATPASTGGATGGDDAQTPPRLDVSPSWRYISPNGDGRRDRVRFRVTVDTDVRLTVRLAKVGGRGTNVLVDGQPVEAGTTVVVWNGRLRRPNGLVAPAADGPVNVVVTATDAADRSSTVTRRVIVDTRPPVVRLERLTPEPWSGHGALTVRFRARDAARPVTVWVRAQRRGRLVAESKRRRPTPATRTLTWYPRDRHRFLAPGGYRAEVVARDAAGNTGRSQRQAFRVHRRVTTSVITTAPRGNRVALTIDDCVDGRAWASMLDTLRRLRAGATFFCNGENVQRYPHLARRTAAQARVSIGSHSVGHRDLAGLGRGSVLQALLGDQATWWNVARATPVPFFRPPYGSHNSTVRAAAGDLGFPYTVLWDVDTEDWRSPGAAVVAQRAVGSARRGSIILLHVKSGTAQALPAIVNGLRARGLEPSGMAEMLSR